jgi:hypothetical protein
MKKKILILLGVVVAVTTPMVPQSQALRLDIAVGDQAYYHGGGYWNDGYYWVWVPGHYSHAWHRWVPGHYNRRGGYNHAYARTHFRHHKVWVSDHNWH